MVQGCESWVGEDDVSEGTELWGVGESVEVVARRGGWVRERRGEEDGKRGEEASGRGKRGRISNAETKSERQ